MFGWDSCFLAIISLLIFFVFVINISMNNSLYLYSNTLYNMLLKLNENYKTNYYNLLYKLGLYIKFEYF